MAKLQVLIAMTLNGSVPARNDSLLQWIQNSNDGFPCWRDRYTRMLYPGYPLVDLICDKEQSAPSDIYLAEIYDDSSAELLRGLSLYHLIDEMVIFLLPVISCETVPVSQHISTDKWKLVRTKTFRNGICRLTYNKISGITSKNGRNDAKRLNIRVVTASNDDKPKNWKTQRKADLRRRMVCKSLPVKE